MKIWLGYAPKEIQCPTHGRVQEAIPWAPAYSRITYRLEWRICTLCQILTQKAAAEILKMASSTLSDLLHRIINPPLFAPCSLQQHNADNTWSGYGTWHIRY